MSSDIYQPPTIQWRAANLTTFDHGVDKEEFLKRNAVSLMAPFFGYFFWRSKKRRSPAGDILPNNYPPGGARKNHPAGWQKQKPAGQAKLPGGLAGQPRNDGKAAQSDAPGEKI